MIEFSTIFYFFSIILFSSKLYSTVKKYPIYNIIKYMFVFRTFKARNYKFIRGEKVVIVDIIQNNKYFDYPISYKSSYIHKCINRTVTAIYADGSEFLINSPPGFPLRITPNELGATRVEVSTLDDDEVVTITGNQMIDY